MCTKFSNIFVYWCALLIFVGISVPKHPPPLPYSGSGHRCTLSAALSSASQASICFSFNLARWNWKVPASSLVEIILLRVMQLHAASMQFWFMMAYAGGLAILLKTRFAIAKSPNWLRTEPTAECMFSMLLNLPTKITLPIAAEPRCKRLSKKIDEDAEIFGMKKTTLLSSQIL